MKFSARFFPIVTLFVFGVQAAAQSPSPTPKAVNTKLSVQKQDSFSKFTAQPAQFVPSHHYFTKPEPPKKAVRDEAIQQDPDTLPRYLRDRGTGIPTSQFGTYVRPGEKIVYTFFEYYRDHNFEYKPEEFGFAGNDTDFRGRSRASEGLIFVAYGVNDHLALEFEVATIKATFEKSPLDRSALPSKIVESGLGDVEGQIRWRWNKETRRRPEIFSYVELVIPHNKRKALIGTPGVEVNVGTGVIKGFSWGTMTFRGAVEYANASDSKFDFGEVAVEYLKRISPKWQFYFGLEGTQDELSAIPQIQWFPTKNIFVKVNSGFGITSKATDFAPEIGVGFRFGGRH